MRRNTPMVQLNYFWITCRRQHQILFSELVNDILYTGVLVSFDAYLENCAKLLNVDKANLDPKFPKFIHEGMHRIRRINILQAEEDQLSDFLWRINPSISISAFMTEQYNDSEKNSWSGLPDWLAETVKVWADGDTPTQDWFNKLPVLLQEWVEEAPIRRNPLLRFSKEPPLTNQITSYQLGKPHFRDPTPWNVYVDDVRPCPVGWVYVQNLKDFKCLFPTRGAFGTLPQEISLDHDLGDDEPTGYDILMFLIEMCLEANLDLPTITVHSANPVGRQRILAAIDNWPRMKEVYYSEKPNHVP